MVDIDPQKGEGYEDCIEKEYVVWQIAWTEILQLVTNSCGPTYHYANECP
jgi:hypothetical protein